MKIRLINVHYRGKSPGDELVVNQGEADYLVKSGNAVKAESKNNQKTTRPLKNESGSSQDKKKKESK